MAKGKQFLVVAKHPDSGALRQYLVNAKDAQAAREYVEETEAIAVRQHTEARQAEENLAAMEDGREPARLEHVLRAHKVSKVSAA